ncbi:sugar ABC transporter permease [Phototrophicus methaneseepsis]|uniref:Sugar ABC transporter permease n=1 Tax=Phototrophicus methaneseepsis TaxID=2710758 RepID=A0A7S8EAP5_9CHLR|nr:sugar ABC transporter permease [Phototrophicus methaneseepsis]QPC83348.1 sugar ABC transporter permease [Phototrophicus methaneseepsis]
MDTTVVSNANSQEHPSPISQSLKRLLFSRGSWVGYLFILPWFIGMIWFDAFPLVANIYLGSTDYAVGPVENANWVGLDNYVKMFTEDELFIKSIGNTVYYIVLSVPLTLLLSFGIALLLNTNIRMMGLFRTIYYIPSVIPIVAASVIFLWMFNARSGAVNQLLYAVGIQPIRWLTNPDYIKLTLVLVGLWGFGSQMIVFLAALQGIPAHLYEAVSIDGGGLFARLRYVTIPLMTPTIFFNMLVGLIASFQVFATAFIMLGANGGALQSGLFYMMHTYNNAFRYFQMGYAAALSLVLFIAMFLVNAVMMWSSNRWVYYGDE